MKVSRLDSYLSTLSDEAEARVWSSLKRTLTGNDLEDYVTPLVPDGDADYWRQNLSEGLFSELSIRAYPWLMAAEANQKEKIGSYSQMLPYSDRQADVHSYFDRKSSTPDVDLLRTAIQMVIGIMPSGLDPVSLSESVRKMPRGTNLGAPYFSSDEKWIPGVYALAEAVEHDGYALAAEKLPALMFWRGQPRGLGQVSKNRTVWGVSHVTIAHGLRVQIPLLYHLRQRVEFAAWNASDVIDRAVTHAFDVSKRQIISVDFSKYDASLHPILMEGAWMIIRRCFTDRHVGLINWLQDQMFNVPLLTPEGILSGEHAMPSGDANTNLVDGLCQENPLELRSTKTWKSAIVLISTRG